MANKALQYLLLAGHLLLATACAAGPSKKNSNTNTGGEDHHTVRYKGKTFEEADLSALLHEKKGTPFKLFEFDDCTFQKSVRFSPVENTYLPFTGTCVFRNCSFDAGIQANMTQFLGQVNFVKCRFKQNTNFQNAVFMGPAGFKDCTFDGDAQFQNCIFMKESSFMSSHVYGVALFQAARFSEKAQFGNVVFHAAADFSQCRFDEGAGFDYVRIEGTLDFTDSRNMGVMNFRAAELKRTQLVNLRSFGLVRFTETSFGDSLVTRGARFFAEPLQVSKPKGSMVVKETN